MRPKNLVALLALLLVLVLAVGGCNRGPDEAGPESPYAKEVDTVRLARVGTIGDYPDEKSSVIVNMDPEREITVRRKSYDLITLKRFLESRAGRTREEGTALKASRLHVVLRLDRELPWREAQWLMQACADPDVRIYRVHFAVLPEEGEEEGTIAAWLPKERPLARTLERIEEIPEIHVDLTARGPAVEPAALFSRLRDIVERCRKKLPCPVVVQLRADGWVPVGYVLRVMDVICRAGVDGITFTGAPPPRPGAGDGGVMDRAGAEPAGPGIRLFGEDLLSSLGSPDLPAVVRKRGGYAGSQGADLSLYLEEIAPDIIEEKPIEQDETVIEDPVFKNTKVPGHNVPDSDMPYEEDLGEKDFLGDAPFDGPSTNAEIGIGGGSGGAFGGRGARRGLRAGGGSSATESAVNLGLEWLKGHQDPGGFWDSGGFMKMDKVDPICDGGGNPRYDSGVSALALLAFLGAGETHKHGKYQKTVREGLRYLKQIQDPEGCFGPRTMNNFTYNHAVATLAMVEAYGMTQSPLFEQSAQRAIDFIERCRNPDFAWRYGIRPGDNDTAVSGWMVAALKSAKTAGLRVDPAGFDGMKAWLEKITDPEHGRVGYTRLGTRPARPQDLMARFPGEKSESLTAVGILSRIFLGEDPKSSEMIRKGTSLCLATLPRWDEQSGAIDMYYWYYGSMAMYQVGGDAWARWNAAMKPAIFDHQRKDGSFRGSWDPVGPWGGEGGRVYSTALMVLCLEVYCRYARVFDAAK